VPACADCYRLGGWVAGKAAVLAFQKRAVSRFSAYSRIANEHARTEMERATAPIPFRFELGPDGIGKAEAVMTPTVVAFRDQMRNRAMVLGTARRGAMVRAQSTDTRPRVPSGGQAWCDGVNEKLKARGGGALVGCRLPAQR